MWGWVKHIFRLVSPLEAQRAELSLLRTANAQLVSLVSDLSAKIKVCEAVVSDQNKKIKELEGSLEHCNAKLNEALHYGGSVDPESFND